LLWADKNKERLVINCCGMRKLQSLHC
jgi:hypothetical protein